MTLSKLEILLKIHRKGGLLPRNRRVKDICNDLQAASYVEYGAVGYYLTEAGRKLIQILVKEWME